MYKLNFLTEMKIKKNNAVCIKISGRAIPQIGTTYKRMHYATLHPTDQLIFLYQNQSAHFTIDDISAKASN